ncbi:uncharacterized protein At5g41620 [Phoenix dactylifera]|uniref:Uncharacterized protein At5g41620 n=1 Tax=Phoenix dactylifera TaxID=42345 RepID=A0A8B7CA59_PHODC|nr:uncharacterized protein At5g41620 [Phoenix dactylifera]
MEAEKWGAAVDEGSRGGGKESSLGRKLRQGISVGKRGGPSTPVPSWKLEDSPGPSDPGGLDRAQRRRSSVSARKLGANLWEIQDLLDYPRMSRRSARTRRRKEGRGIDDVLGEWPLGPKDRPLTSGSLRRHVAASPIQQHKLSERHSHAPQPVSPTSYSSSMEVAAFNQAITPSSSLDLKGKLSEAGYSLKTSTELLKVLNRIWSLEEQHASNASLVKQLKMELEHARACIQELMQEKQAYRHEMDDLVKQVSQAKLVRKNKEQERIKAAVQSIRDELEDERRLRRRSESLHRKLGKELSEVKAAFLKAVKDLEREKKANSLLEDLCDEFAKGIRDYEQEVRELRQKSVKGCDHKVDRMVLHISEAWLDERMQMKIAKSRGDLAEKSTVTDRLNGEIESFLQARQSNSYKNDGVYQKDGNLRRQSLESVHLNGAASAPRDAEDDDSVASDLHCFELNMVGGDSEIYDQLKSHGRSSIEKLESARKSNFTGKKVGYSENFKGQNVSGLQAQFKEQMDKMKLCGNEQLVDRVQVIHLQTDEETGGVEADHIGRVISQKSDNHHVPEVGQGIDLKWDSRQGSDHLIDNAVKNQSEICEVDQDNYHGEQSQDQFSWRGHFVLVGDNTASGDFHNLASPARQWNYLHTSPDIEISECSSKLPSGVKENTLKEKLLEARLEGQHARLKASKGPATGRMRQ